MRRILFVCVLAGAFVAGALPRPANLPKQIHHSVDSYPVKIMNLFPEHGLTDPHAMIVGDRLYVGCGRDQSWNTEDTWRMDCWEFWSTDNLKDWRYESTLWPTETYIGDRPNCWAGDLIQKDGRFFWYFSNRNIDAGVAVSDRPGGPYHDALGKPLLPGTIIKGNPYDPEIFREEDGTCYIIFSANTYYIATLGEDMISLADEPQPIVVRTPDGQRKWTADKSSLFKRDGVYYLVWGSDYAMSDKLHGPYTYRGRFLNGGHGSIFNWKGQWYVLQENKDISLFYRGVMLKPVLFNEDKTIRVPGDDSGYPAGGRTWNFDRSAMGWRAVSGTSLNWGPSGVIRGDVSGNAVIRNAVWGGALLTQNKTILIRLRNRTPATQARISVASFDSSEKRFWAHPDVDWNAESQSVTFDINPNDPDFTDYVLDLSSLSGLKSNTKQIQIEPALGAKSGSWEIDCIRQQCAREK